MLRAALVVLSVGVVLAAVGAVVEGSQLLPRATKHVVAADALTAPRPTTALRAAGDATAVEADPTSFTLGELDTGEVSAERFTAFWDAVLEDIRTAPCAPTSAPGATVVRVDLGATPPAHLGDDYPDYAPLLTDARAEAAAGC